MANFGELFKSAEEHPTPVEASVKGTIPEWLRGSVIRVGPGKYDLGDDFVMDHFFDGYAILYKFHIADSKVEFCSQFLHSKAYERAVNVGRPVMAEFGTKAYPDPCKNIFSRMMSTLLLQAEMTDNDCVNVIGIEDGIFACTESRICNTVDPTNLNTLDKFDWQKMVSVNFATAHPCYDPDSGATYNMGSALNASKYHVFKIPKADTCKMKDALDKTEMVGKIPVRPNSSTGYCHSFGLSADHVVFVEQPLVFNSLALMKVVLKISAFADALQWQPQNTNLFHVMEKSTGRVLNLKFETETPFFVFHHINTYQQNNQLIVDLIAYDSSEIITKLYLKTLRKSEFNCKDIPGARRFVLPLPPANQNEDEWLASLKENENLVVGAEACRRGNTIFVKPHLLTEKLGYEMPTINPANATKPYNYFYSAGLYLSPQFQNSLLKVDVRNGETKTWKENEFTYPSEAHFVGRPDSTEEDDGVLLSSVTDVRTGHKDFLVVLDARTMTEVARAEVEVQVPQTFHGNFFKNVL